MTPSAGTSVTDGSSTALAQRDGRALLIAMNAAIRAVRLYPIENAAVQRAIEELGRATDRVLEQAAPCEVRCVSDQFFVNDTRLRLAFDNYAAVAALMSIFRAAGLGGLTITATPPGRAWVVLLSSLQATPGDLPVDERLPRLQERLDQAGIDTFVLSAPVEAGEASGEAPRQRERARRAYVRSIEVTREVITSARLGSSEGLRYAKRAVQSIVDMIMRDSTSLLGLTTLRDFDERTFVHSVNVCILSVALGRRLGLSKAQLLDLGLCSLLHDVGKSRVPVEILNSTAPLTEAQRAVLETHTWQGVLALFHMPTGVVRPWRAMMAAYEHHMQIDHRGYPVALRPRRLSLFSRIIAVADAFDMATANGAETPGAGRPYEAVQAMRDDAALGLDPVLVKAFINLVGVYPMGTLVVLDTYELAIVVAPNPQATALSRPLVRIIMDDRGNAFALPALVDLTARDANGGYARSIIRTDDPERYAITLGDYVD